MRRSVSNFAVGLREAWSLARPYFISEERWPAIGLLSAIIALNLMMVGMNVVLTYWNRDFFNAIQTYDARTVVHLLFYPLTAIKGAQPMPGFVEIVTIVIFVYVYATFLNQMLQIRWRQWLTQHYIENWLSERTYYNISLSHTGDAVVDNPDQRIADDLNSFTASSLSLGLDFISNVVTLFSFVFTLYVISGSITLLGFTIHGYMVWVALIYSLVGTVFTHYIGRKLIGLSFNQQRVEADFRYGLIRIRDNPEAIALYRGEGDEQLTLTKRFGAVRENWWAIMRRTKGLNFFTIGFAQIANIFPLVVILPRYFAKEIGFGGLSQIPLVFGQVQGALSWFVNSYQELVTYRATVSRLHGFREAMEAAREAAASGPRRESPGAALTLDNLTLTLPDGRKLLEHASLTLPPGEAVIVTGPSGAGKSTLFRAIAGIWPFGDGSITPPSGSVMFLPQRPYFPNGSLKRSVVYPAFDHAIADAEASAALETFGLGHLVPRLGEIANWGQILSGGEQQRLALARALIAKPDWLFLDEAMSSLDPALAAQVQETLRKTLPGTTIVSISHHESPTADERHVTLADGALHEGYGVESLIPT
jgi:putative ATP-binding cassette transporter